MKSVKDVNEEIGNAVDFFHNDMVYEGLSHREVVGLVQDYLKEEKGIEVSKKKIFDYLMEE